MDFAKVGYYPQRAKARVPIDKGSLRAAFGNRPDRVRVEVMEGFIVLTDPNEQAWRFRND